VGSNTIHTTDANFESDVLKSDIPVLVDFWAEWCGPCRAVAPKLDEIATEYAGKVKIVKINIDDNQESAARFNVRSIPMMILFKGGQSVGQLLGNLPKDSIVDLVKKGL
jgi:thioredoxin 1